MALQLPPHLCIRPCEAQTESIKKASEFTTLQDLVQADKQVPPRPLSPWFGHMW
jgi:hypothetical protein